jgi:3-oxoacyl-[acyl-carrier protein] reductase
MAQLTPFGASSRRWKREVEMPTAVVTGAARGLGRAMAERLLADGFDVWAVDSDAAELDRTAADTGVHPVALDVTDEQAVADLVAQLPACDALVNNAGIWRFTKLADTPIDEARRVLEVNVVAPLLWMQRFLPLLQQSSGSIVNISSITAAMSPTGTGVYPPSKAALEAMTRMAAVEFGPLGVRCNAVGPGIVPTEGTLAHYGDDETRTRRGRTLPAQRFGRPEDVADVVSFFCSDAARYVTGQVIYVDGGYTAAGADFFRLARDAGAR